MRAAHSIGYSVQGALVSTWYTIQLTGLMIRGLPRSALCRHRNKIISAYKYWFTIINTRVLSLRPRNDPAPRFASPGETERVLTEAHEGNTVK